MRPQRDLTALPDSPCELRVRMLLEALEPDSEALEPDSTAIDDTQLLVDLGWVDPPSDAAEQNRLGCAYARQRQWEDARDWLAESARSLDEHMARLAKRNLKRVLLAQEAAGEG